MVTKRLEGCGRDGVDRVAADQGLHVVDVGIGRVLGARARPEQSLRARSRGGESLPTGAREELLVALVRKLGIGDRHLALQLPSTGTGLFEQPIDGGVDPAHEEACNRGHARYVAASPSKLLEAGEIGLDHLLVDRVREEKRDVDVHALRCECADGRESGVRRRHFDHHVLAVELAPQPLRLGDRALGVVSEGGRDLERDEAVTSLRLVVGVTEDGGRRFDVAQG